MSKVIVVTGASVGIGAAILKLLAENGHQVIGLARRAELIQVIADEHPDWKIDAIAVDVSKDADVTAAFETIKEKYEKIDAIVNNAGMMILSSVADGNMDQWKQMYNLNVFGVFSCVREALKIISDDGNIINVSSTLGQNITSTPMAAIYSSTKHALKVITTGLRAELYEKRPGLKVSLLNPGLVKSDMTQGFIEGTQKTDYIHTEDIAQAALYMISTPQFVNVAELTVQHSSEYIK